MPNITRNTATFLRILRHGNDPRIADLANTVFTDVVLSDGTQLKDLTFAELADQIWTKVTRNTATYSNVSRN